MEGYRVPENAMERFRASTEVCDVQANERLRFVDSSHRMMPRELSREVQRSRLAVDEEQHDLLAPVVLQG